VPISLTCEKGIFGEVPRVEGRGGTGPVQRTNTFHPQSPNGLGEFLAMDMKTGNVLWRYRTRTPMNSAALTTGGGLAIVGDWDRYVYVFDAASGKVLFQSRMPTSVQGFPITYAVRGKQYLAIPVGTGGGSWTSQVPVELTPEKTRPNNANGIYVFALPERSTTSTP
jgi:alcohol dehydrogenase (cytochrome c)